MALDGAVATHVAKPSDDEVEDHVPVKNLLLETNAILSVCVLADVLMYVTVILADDGTLRKPLISKNSTVKLAEPPCSILKGPLWNTAINFPQPR